MKLTRLEIHYGGNIDEREKNGRIMRESSYITEYVLQKLSKENFLTYEVYSFIFQGGILTAGKYSNLKG